MIRRLFVELGFLVAFASPKPPPMKRCRSCSAWNEGGAETCSSCGAGF